jgi:RNA polymerase sigma factor (sigma-70 family)
VTKPGGPSERAFLELLEQHADIFRKVSRAYCPFASQRPDLVQEMTIALWRSFGAYDASRPFATWMYRIVLNVAISFFRSESRHAQRRASLDGVERPGKEISTDPRVGRLLECIDRLGPLDKALVIMYLDGYPYADIADVLGITHSNAGTKLARIKERLRAAMSASERGVRR